MRKVNAKRSNTDLTRAGVSQTTKGSRISQSFSRIWGRKRTYLQKLKKVTRYIRIKTQKKIIRKAMQTMKMMNEFIFIIIF